MNEAGVDRHGFNPWVGAYRWPGAGSFIGPLSVWTCSDSGWPAPNWKSVTNARTAGV